MDCRESRKLMRKKSSRRHKTSKRKRPSESSGDESVDLSEKVFPIAHYLDNKQEMIEQVFSAVDGEKLYCMLPPILKGMPIGVLKEKCLKELVNMSDNEVRKVLCGESIKSQLGNVATPHQKDSDSDSHESSSSVEELFNHEQDNRTLLDILEQEMQAIAYNTVMKKDDISILHVTKALSKVTPEAQADSSCKKNKVVGVVPLICLDSDDDYEAVHHSPSTNHGAAVESTPLIDLTPEIYEGRTSPIQSEDIEEASKVDQIVVDLSPFVGQDEEIISQTSDQPKSKLCLTQSNVKPRENFVIQVFSNKSNFSDRVVKKVNIAGVGSQNVESMTTASTVQHTTACFCPHCRVSVESDKEDASAKNNCCNNLMKTSDIPSTSHEEESHLNTVIVSQETLPTQPDFIVSQSSKSHDLSSVSLSVERPMETKELGAIKSCETEEIPKMEVGEIGEREEGEITGGESEEDIEVLETVQERQRSPSIVLSSDSNGARSDQEHQSRNHVRKHHRRRKSKKPFHSPEQSKTIIEKRGNRNYRCKTVSSNQKGDKRAEKQIESSQQNLEPSSSEPLDDVTLSIDNISGKVSAQHENLILEEQPPTKEKEIKETDFAVLCNHPVRTFSEKCVSSSEETEISENVTETVCENSSWADRWAQKKDLKKVVITSKIYRTVRKRILSARQKQTKKETLPVATDAVLPPVPPLVLHVEGSVQEYQMLQCFSDVGNEPPLISPGASSQSLSSGVVEHLNSVSPDVPLSIAAVVESPIANEEGDSKIEVPL